MVCVCRLTQGAALGYVLLPLRGVSLTTFDTSPTLSPESSSLSSTLPPVRARTAPTKQAGISPTERTEHTEPSGREAPPTEPTERTEPSGREVPHTDWHGCAQIRRVWHPAIPTQPAESSSISSTLPPARARTVPTKQAGISPTERTEHTEPSGREAPPTDWHRCAQIRRVWHPAIPTLPPESSSLSSTLPTARARTAPQGYRPQNAQNTRNLLAEKYLPQMRTDAHRLGGYGILPYPRCLRNPVVLARLYRLSEQELHQQNKQGYRPQNAQNTQNLLAEKHLPQIGRCHTILLYLCGRTDATKPSVQIREICGRTYAT